MEIEQPLQKRSKINAEERSRQFHLLEESFKSFKDCLDFKERQLNRDRCFKNFKECDNITQQMNKIRQKMASIVLKS